MTNYLMLFKIAKTGKPIILSSGMSDYKELDECIEFLKPFGNELSLLQCTTAYPTKPEQWGLKEIPKLKERYGIPIGYSDHSSDITACIAATALGAEILEFHAVFDKNMFGPDAKASLDLDEISMLVKSVRKLEISLKQISDKADISSYNDLKILFGKSLTVNKNLSQGHVITVEDLESKKPANIGIAAKEFSNVLGSTLKKPLLQWDFLRLEDLE
jgi:N-acetylneuraminate synthase